MPRVETRQATATAAASALDVRFSRWEGQLRVSLAGILDQQGLTELVRKVSLVLSGRGRTVILDGAGLLHMDYRCVQPLVQWNRGLRAYGHQVRLAGWSRYLEAILAMEDWDRELERPRRAMAAAPRRPTEAP